MKHITVIVFVINVICARSQYVQDAVGSYENVNDELGNFLYSFQMDSAVAQPQKINLKSNSINIHINVANKNHTEVAHQRSQKVLKSEIEEPQPQTVLNPLLINVANIQNNTNIRKNYEPYGSARLSGSSGDVCSARLSRLRRYWTACRDVSGCHDQSSRLLRDCKNCSKLSACGNGSSYAAQLSRVRYRWTVCGNRLSQDRLEWTACGDQLLQLRSDLSACGGVSQLCDQTDRA